MLSSRKKKNQQKEQLSQLYETSNDFVIGNSVNLNVSKNEILEQQTNGQVKDFVRVDDSAGQKQVIVNINDNQIIKAVSSAAMTIKNRMHDATLTAIDNIVIPRVVTAIKSIIGSTRHGTNSDVQNCDQLDFIGKIRNTSLLPASSCLDLDAEINRRNDESCSNVDCKDGNFPALKHNYDRREHAHHRKLVPFTQFQNIGKIGSVGHSNIFKFLCNSASKCS